MTFDPMPPVERAARALGPIVDQWTLEQAIVGVLQERLVAWLDEANRQAGELVRVERPRSWTADDGVRPFPEDQLPCVMVVVPGTVDRPVHRGDGSWDATFSVGLGAIVAHQSHEGARRKAALYGAALRTLALQHLASALPQIAAVDWIGTGTGALPDLIDEGKRRQLAVADEAFEIRVAGIADDRGAAPFLPGPDDLPNDGDPVDVGDLPTVLHTDLALEGRTP
jgi:hypothetical protein